MTGDGDTSLLRVRNASVALAGQPVLDSVDVSVAPGEIVTLIGPNGSGKTTLVRLALGLIVADSGTIHRARGLRIGYVPQVFSLDETLPLTTARLLALTGAGDRDRVREALEQVGASRLLDRPVQGLSAGETKRALLARALLRQPGLLVLDEPAASVDMTGQAEFYALLGRLRDATGCGILLVSHDLHLVMAATDTVVCLHHHVCCTGTPEAVTRHPEYLALFGPELAAGLAVYEHDHDHHLDLSGERIDDPHTDADAAPPHG